MMFVSAEEASLHLRREMNDWDDADLHLKIQAASEAVMDYLKWSELPAEIPARVRQAVLLTVGDMYRDREGERISRLADQFGYGYSLPPGATALLYSLRHPSVA